MKIYSIIFALVISTTLVGQNTSGLVLEYNLYTDEVVYTKNNIVIPTPYVEVNENIKVVIKEFNPYIQRATINIDKINYNQSSNEFAAQSMGGGSSMDGIAGLLGGFSMGGDVGNVFGDIPGSRGVSSQEMMQLKAEFTNLTAELENVESKLNSAHHKIKLFQKVEKSKTLALTDITALKTNENIRPSRIKELITEEINYAFAKADNEEIDINDLVDEMEKEKDFKESLTTYAQAKDEYQQISKKWSSFLFGLKLLSGDNGDLEDTQDLQLEFIQNSSDSIVDVINDNVRKFDKLQIDTLADFYDEDQNNQSMAQLRQVYEEMQGNNFSYSFAPIQAEGDEVTIEISVSKKNEIGSYDSYKTLIQTVQVSGGWKISGGVGLCFGGFKNPTFKYSVSDGVIIGDRQDAFIPIVASFAHFYKNTYKSFNLGGSFGIGLPILGGNSITSASFFLGPTAIVGKKQRFLLTTGLMGAKADRLSDLYKVGDSFDNPAELLPINQRYELGFFIGISFNVI